MESEKKFMKKLTSYPVGSLSGDFVVPGDKSISHRSLMFGALAEGKTKIYDILDGEDILSTASCLKKLGVRIEKNEEDGSWAVHGVGLDGLKEPSSVLDMGNAGTGARLMMGILAGQKFSSVITGDDSLKKRPMGRVVKPLEQMGAKFVDENQGCLPLKVVGGEIKPMEYELPVASAQVKSAILLAGLFAKGETVVVEPKPTRDHSEKMLNGFGASVQTVQLENGGNRISLKGKPKLKGQEIVVPSDFSSAAFPIVAAIISDKANVRIKDVGVNPLRSGLLVPLIRMGADIKLENQRLVAGEEIADIVVKNSKLKAIELEGDIAPKMIDEYPILAVAASFAQGTTKLKGLSELRVKESDRLDGTFNALKACGVKTKIEGDDLIVYGNGMKPKGGACVSVDLDHRMAMSFLVMGTSTEEPISVDDASPIATSFPSFVEILNSAGADIK
jgi:3-phosphoshikimate 1-carboxyvinyltransferase